MDYAYTVHLNGVVESGTKEDAIKTLLQRIGDIKGDFIASINVTGEDSLCTEKAFREWTHGVLTINRNEMIRSKDNDNSNR